MCVCTGGILTITFFSIPPLLLPANNNNNNNTRRRQQEQQEQENQQQENQQQEQQQDKSESSTTTTTSNIPHLLHQWLYIYNKGGKTFPYLVAGSALAYAYVVYYLLLRHAGSRTGWSTVLYRIYLFASAVTISAIPFSLAFVEPLAKKLLSIIAKEDDNSVTPREEGEVPRLIDAWAKWNVGRGIFPFVGAVVGVVGALWF